MEAGRSEPHSLKPSPAIRDFVLERKGSGNIVMECLPRVSESLACMPILSHFKQNSEKSMESAPLCFLVVARETAAKAVETREG